MVRVTQTYSIALYSLHHLVYCRVLGYDLFFQFYSHITEPDTLSLLHSLHRDARHHRNDVGYLVLIDFRSFTILTFLPFKLHGCELVLQLRLSVAVAGCHFKVLCRYGRHFLGLNVLYLLFCIDDFLWNLIVLQMNAGTNLIKCIYSLIREIAIGDITVGELHAGHKGIVCVSDMMMILITSFDVLKDL